MASTKITDSTLIPISFISVIVGTAIWVGSIKSIAEDAQAQIIRDEKMYDKRYSDELKFLQSIDERLSSIEGQLKVIMKHTE